MSAELFLDLARAIERAGMDYLLIEDSIYVGQNWKNSRDIFLRNGMSIPRQEPTVVASLMAAVTKHLGIVPTLSTFAYHPYLTARIVGRTLDQVSGGRGGWNMVTGSSDFSAQNFRHGRSCRRTCVTSDTKWRTNILRLSLNSRNSWDPDAIVADHETGVLIDPGKVHTIDYKGKYYSSRGPLNSGPCPQGRPVIAQAGGSGQLGRRFAAKWADTIVAHPKGVEAMKEYRTDIRARMVAAGRDPDSCKVLFLVLPRSSPPVHARRRRIRADRRQTRQCGRPTSTCDWRRWAGPRTSTSPAHDLDAPVAELTTNGHQSSLANFLRRAGGKTLREAIVGYSTSGGSVDLVGTPDDVAAQMGEVMDAVGGDGFLFSLGDVSRQRAWRRSPKGWSPRCSGAASPESRSAASHFGIICWSSNRGDAHSDS